MKKLLLFLALGLVGGVCFADDTYEYFTVRHTDGACESYKIDGLKLLFSDVDGITVVSPGKDDAVFPAMYVDALLFTATDLTAIESVVAVDEDEAEVYTIDGRLVAKGRDARAGLAAGVYIVKTGNKSTKISVR